MMCEAKKSGLVRSASMLMWGTRHAVVVSDLESGAEHECQAIVVDQAAHMTISPFTIQIGTAVNPSQ